MSGSSEAADQVVKMTLEGTETALRLAGSGARRAAELLCAALKDGGKSSGKTRLAGLLRSGKELRVFAVRDGDLRTFCAEAKRYGVLYTVLRDRNASDGVTDVLVRSEDAGKVSRIFERYGLSADARKTERGEERTEPVKDAAEPDKTAEKEIGPQPAAAETEKETGPAPQTGVPETKAQHVPAPEKDKAGAPEETEFLTRKEKAEQFAGEIMKAEKRRDPADGPAGTSPRYGPSSARRQRTERDISERRPSVKRQLADIRRDMRHDRETAPVHGRVRQARRRNMKGAR